MELPAEGVDLDEAEEKGTTGWTTCNNISNNKYNCGTCGRETMELNNRNYIQGI